MNNAYKIIRYFSSTKTIPVGSYRFTNKENVNRLIKHKNINNRIIGTSESHALPIKLNETKISIYKEEDNKENNKENYKQDNKQDNKIIPQFTKKEFNELMKIVS